MTTQCTAQLDELRSGFANLKDHLNGQVFQKMDACRQRHRQLNRLLLQVLASLEMYCQQAGAARRDPVQEAKLEDRFNRLEQAIAAPGSAKARLEELWVVLRGLGAASASSGSFTESEAQKTLEVSDIQGEMLDLLQEQVAWRKRDIAQFESAMAHFV